MHGWVQSLNCLGCGLPQRHDAVLLCSLEWSLASFMRLMVGVQAASGLAVKWTHGSLIRLNLAFQRHQQQRQLPAACLVAACCDAAYDLRLDGF